MSDLPNGWTLADLGQLGQWGSGGTPTRTNADYYYGGTIPWLVIGDLNDGYVRQAQTYITQVGLSNSSAKLVPPESLLVAMYGSIGKLGISTIECATNQAIAFCRPDLRIVTLKYLFHALYWAKPALLNLGQGGAQQNINQGVLKSFQIPLAPLEEQIRIADQLDTLLARVNACNDHLDAIPGILKRFRQAVLNAAISEGFLCAAPAVPFRVVRLVEVLAEPLRNGKSVPDGNGMSVLRLTSLRSSEIDLKESKSGDWSKISDIRRFLVQDGDYLVSRGNGSRELVGRGGLVSGCKEEIAFPDTMIRIRPDKTELLSDYLKYVWSSQFVREQIERLAKTTAGIWKVSQQDLESIRLPLPTPDDQRVIANHIEELLKIADRIESRYIAVRTHAQRLAPQVLAKAFRGELVGQDPQDESASVLLHRLAANQPTKASASRGRPRARPKAQPSAPDDQPTDWVSLPNGAWAAPADPEGQAAAVWLTAVLRAWREPMPERTARLASLLCQQPHLFTTVLSEGQAELWSRLVGDEAKPLPANVARFQPSTNSHWGHAIKNMRVRGDFIEAGAGDEVMWTLGPGAASIETAGWPDGRAGFVVAHLRAHGVESILPSLEPAVLEFVDARAA